MLAPENRIGLGCDSIFIFFTAAAAAASVLARSLFAQLTIQCIVYEVATSPPLRVFSSTLSILSMCVLFVMYAVSLSDLQRAHRVYIRS